MEICLQLFIDNVEPILFVIFLTGGERLMIKAVITKLNITIKKTSNFLPDIPKNSDIYNQYRY